MVKSVTFRKQYIKLKKNDDILKKTLFIPQKYISPYRKGNNEENKLLLIHNKAAKLENKKIKNYGGKSYECN